MIYTAADVSKDKVLSAVSIDFQKMSLFIDTDDIETFSGKQVELEVVPLQDQVDQANKLLIKVQFDSKEDNQ